MTSYNAVLSYAQLPSTTLSCKTSGSKTRTHKNVLTTAPATLRSQLPKISLTFLLSMETVSFTFLKPSKSPPTETESFTPSPNSLLSTKSIKTFKKSHFTQNLKVLLEKLLLTPVGLLMFLSFLPWIICFFTLWKSWFGILSWNLTFPTISSVVKWKSTATIKSSSSMTS